MNGGKGNESSYRKAVGTRHNWHVPVTYASFSSSGVSSAKNSEGEYTGTSDLE